jgi:hypothetical protein
MPLDPLDWPCQIVRLRNFRYVNIDPASRELTLWSLRICNWTTQRLPRKMTTEIESPLGAFCFIYKTVFFNLKSAK